MPEEIGRFANLEPHKTKSVGITLRYPSFTDLTPDQLSYYTYWKSTIGTGDFTKVPEGYLWLLVCELVSSPDKETCSRKLNLLAASTMSDGSPYYPQVLGAAIEFSMVNGTPLPPFSPWMASVPECRYLSRALAAPVSCIEPRILRGILSSDITTERASEIGTVLRAYDETLSSRTGRSLRDTFCRPVKESHMPFRDYVCTDRCVPIETVSWEPDVERFTKLLRTVIGLLDGEDGTDMQGIPCGFELAEIVRDSREKTCEMGPDLFAKKDGILFRNLGTECTEHGPSRYCDPTVDTVQNGHINLGDILTFGNASPSREVGFVPSGREHPTYNDLNREQFNCFLQWKRDFRNGKYTDTDNGYLNLFITEIINTDKGLETAELLSKLGEVYGGGESNPINRVIVDHSIMNGYGFTDYHLQKDKFVVNSWIESFIKGGDQMKMDKEILDMMRFGSMTASSLDVPIPLKPFSRALRRIFAEIDEKTDIDTVLEPKNSAAKRTLYFGYDYLRGPREKIVTYADYIGCRKFVNFIDKAVDYMKYLMETEDRKKKPFTFGKVNCASILYEEYIVSNGPASPKEQAQELKLDLDAIKAAEADLSDVTEMMRVDEEEDTEEAPASPGPVKEGPSDAWGSFFASLTDGERRYLRACITKQESPSQVLKDIGLNRLKVEDSINNKSLDTVGDTVIEDGESVEDYTEELEKGL